MANLKANSENLKLFAARKVSKLINSKFSLLKSALVIALFTLKIRRGPRRALEQAA